MNTRHALIPGAMIAMLLALAGCSGDSQQQAEAPLVGVAKPEMKEVPADDEFFTGRTNAQTSIDIRARVTGYLDKVLFTDGDEVKKGNALFEIDERPYRALLDRAKGQVTQATARKNRLAQDVSRAERGISTGAVTKEDFDRALGDKAEADAALKAAEANVAAYQQDVDYCKIAAPIDGRISRTQIDPGNLVKGDFTLLTNIVSVDPIDVDFHIDEGTLLQIQRKLREGKVKTGDKEGMTIYVGTSDEKGTPHKGTLTFLDNKVDPTTGTLPARAAFPNPKVNAEGKENEKGSRVLTPGLFVRVRVPVGEAYQAMLVAERALMSDQGKRFVYIVKDGKAERREVDIGANKDGLRVILPLEKRADGTIARGLEPNDLVIVNNIQRVRAGKPVRHEAPVSMSSMTTQGRSK